MTFEEWIVFILFTIGINVFFSNNSVENWYFDSQKKRGKEE